MCAHSCIIISRFRVGKLVRPGYVHTSRDLSALRAQELGGTDSIVRNSPTLPTLHPQTLDIGVSKYKKWKDMIFNEDN